ncbi:MAG: hypothetical protein IJK31_00695 [Ruminococcus sp.]|nr:hypothetical protein [Ruminococcus sp.]
MWLSIKQKIQKCHSWIKNFLSDSKKLYSLDAGLFLTGIILALISFPDENTTRGTISCFMIYFSYALFPFMTRESKEKVMSTIAKHFAMTLLSLFALGTASEFYLNKWGGSSIIYELLAALLLIFGLSYTAYVLIGVGKAFVYIVSKLRSLLFSNSTEEKYSTAKKIIGGISALIVALTGIASSAAALIVAMNKFIK